MSAVVAAPHDSARTAPSPPNASPRFRLRRLVTWAILATAAFAIFELVELFAGNNFHAVIPGRVYRSSQPSRARLAHLVKTHGIRTVINLRGCGEPMEWYLEEARATHALNVSQEDLTFSAGQLPSIFEVRRLIEVLENSEPPMLIHCFRGVDRTGLASTLAQLLLTDVSVETARKQLSLRCGHLNLGQTARIDEFFDLYEEWLREREREHSRVSFRHWATTEYCPGACRCRFELPERDPAQPLRIEAQAPFAFRVRAHNTSIRPWTFSPDETAGFHLTWTLLNSQVQLAGSDRSGLFHAVVHPGESIELTVQLPALAAGDYRLQIDLTQENHCAFRHVGGEPLELVLEAR